MQCLHVGCMTHILCLSFEMSLWTKFRLYVIRSAEKDFRNAFPFCCVEVEGKWQLDSHSTCISEDSSNYSDTWEIQRHPLNSCTLILEGSDHSAKQFWFTSATLLSVLEYLCLWQHRKERGDYSCSYVAFSFPWGWIILILKVQIQYYLYLNLFFIPGKCCLQLLMV